MDIIKSMKVFKQVAESQSFSGAADKLNVVPSAVSRQISELETWLNRRLIHRTTRTLHLTQDGKAYLQRIEDILSHIDHLRAESTNNDKLSGKLKITSPVIVGQQDISKIIANFKVQHPDVEILLHLENRSVNIVEEGYDLAIRSGELADSNLYAKKVSSIVFKTVVSTRYFDTNPAIESPYDLADHNCILNTALSNQRRWSYLIHNEVKAIKVGGSLDTNNAMCIVDFVKAGIGVARLPEQYVNDGIEADELVPILESFSIAPLPISLIYPSNRLLSRTTRAMIDAIIGYYEA